MTHSIEVFSAGCSACRETIDLVQKLAGSATVQIRNIQQDEVTIRARELGIRSVPAVVVDGQLAGCCAGRGPDEQVLRAALR